MQQKPLEQMSLIEIESMMWRQEMQIKQCQANIQALDNQRGKLMKPEEINVERVSKQDDSKQGKVQSKKDKNLEE